MAALAYPRHGFQVQPPPIPPPTGSCTPQRSPRQPDVRHQIARTWRGPASRLRLHDQPRLFRFARIDLARHRQHRLGMLRRHDADAIDIADDEIARMHQDAADLHRDVLRDGRGAAEAGARRDMRREDRQIIVALDLLHVAQPAGQQRAGMALGEGASRHDAPRGEFRVARRADDDDGPARCPRSGRAPGWRQELARLACSVYGRADHAHPLMRFLRRGAVATLQHIVDRIGDGGDGDGAEASMTLVSMCIVLGTGSGLAMRARRRGSLHGLALAARQQASSNQGAAMPRSDAAAM